jgi:hypothetical protein
MFDPITVFDARMSPREDAVTPAIEPPADSSAVAFASTAAAAWSRQLGDQILGAYLIGSLAHGGFSQRYSDIDVAVIADAELPSAALSSLRDTASAISPVLAPTLSLFWSDRCFTVGRFPLLDRIDFLDHAVTLLEHKRVRPPRPTLAETRAYLRGAPFHDWTESVRRLANCNVLERKDHKPYLRALLYPARFVFSWIKGGVTSNDQAVAFLCNRAPHGLDVDLIRRSLECRRAGSDPVDLFSERSILPSQVEACRQLLID